VRHHALREQAAERLLHIDLADAGEGAGPETGIEQMQDRMLDPADILFRPAATGDLFRIERAIGGLAGKAQEIPALSTKVSSVSVSRRAAPHCGQSTCFQVGWRSSGLPGVEKSTSSGSVTGKCFLGTGTTPQTSQWMKGIGVPQ
jgi:hypothetical protein